MGYEVTSEYFLKAPSYFCLIFNRFAKIPGILFSLCHYGLLCVDWWGTFIQSLNTFRMHCIYHFIKNKIKCPKADYYWLTEPHKSRKLFPFLPPSSRTNKTRPSHFAASKQTQSSLQIHASAHNHTHACKHPRDKQQGQLFHLKRAYQPQVRNAVVCIWLTACVGKTTQQIQNCHNQNDTHNRDG
jgi:hypothetical protein